MTRRKKNNRASHLIMAGDNAQKTMTVHNNHVGISTGNFITKGRDYENGKMVSLSGVG